MSGDPKVLAGRKRPIPPAWLACSATIERSDGPHYQWHAGANYSPPKTCPLCRAELVRV